MLRHSCDRQGSSLIEVLLSAALVLVVMAIGIGFLVPLLGMQRTRAEIAEVEQRAAVIVEDLRRDLGLTNGSGVSIFQSPDELLLGIHGAENVAQDGTLVWGDTLVVYRWSARDGIWRRGLWKDAGHALLRAGGPTTLDPGKLRQVAALAAAQRVSSGVRAVALEQSGPERGFPLVMRMTLVTSGGQSREIVRTLSSRLPAL